MIRILILASPILGIIGFCIEESWLYYLASIPCLIAVLTMIYSKKLSLTMFELFLAIIIGCWILSSSFIDGLLLGVCAFTMMSNLIAILKSMHIFYTLRKLSSNSKKDDEVHSDTNLNKPIRRISTDKSKEPKWTIKEERPFTQEEIDAIDKAIVVSAQYGNSVQFFMKNGGFTFIPLDSSSTLNAGDEVDIRKAILRTYEKDGEGDIYRVLE